MPFLTENQNELSDKFLIDESVVLEKLLEDFVVFRNDAAHGSPDETLGVDRLREWINFIHSLCLAIEETITHKILEFESTMKPEIIIGDVIHNYSNNIIIAVLNRAFIRNGQELYFFKKDKYTKTKIVSIQLDGNELGSYWSAGNDIEIGIRTEEEVGENASIIMID